MKVRFLRGNEIEKALLLIRKVFLETESQGLIQSAVESFLRMQTKDAFQEILSDEQTIFLGAFYESLGFVVKDQVQEIYGISFVPMEKRISMELY